MLETAGISKEAQAKLFSKAYDKLNELLEAKKTVQFQYQGNMKDSYETNDLIIQLKAAQEVFNFLGVYAPKMAPIRTSENYREGMVDPNVHFNWEGNTGEISNSIPCENTPSENGGSAGGTKTGNLSSPGSYIG